MGLRRLSLISLIMKINRICFPVAPVNGGRGSFYKEELNMNKEEIKYLEWDISHCMEFVEKNREILRKLGDILPPGENFKVSTAAGHCSLSHEELEELKHEWNEKQN